MVRRDEALSALRHGVAGREFEFATVLEVTDGGPDGLLLRVRSGRRLHPHTLVVDADESRLALDHSTGEPLDNDDVQQWTHGMVLWLTEQLDTGVLRCGRRRKLTDGTVAIDPMLEPEPPSPWWVSPVPLERPTLTGQRRLRRLAQSRRGESIAILGGRMHLEPNPTLGGHLRDAGLDVRPGRAAHRAGRLLQWLQLHLDDRGGSPPAGQLVVSWADDAQTDGRLEHLECTPSVPETAVQHLVFAGIHAAADVGASWIEHRFDHRDPGWVGLPWTYKAGAMRLDAADVP